MIKNGFIAFLLVSICSCQGSSTKRPSSANSDTTKTKSVEVGQDSLDDELVMQANAINANCPIQTPYNVTIDSAKALPNKTFRLYFTSTQKGHTNLYDDIAPMKRANLEELKSERMAFYRKKKVTMEYVIYDNKGYVLNSYSILPKEYAD